MGLFDNKEVAEAMADALGWAEDDRPAPHQERYKDGWRAPLNPIQQQAVDDPAIYKLFYGERGTGKCKPINDLCYLSDGISRLGALNPGVLFGWGNLKVDVCAFDGKAIVTSQTTGFYKEPNPEAICWELANGHEMKGSPVHPVWVCQWRPGERATFAYVKLQEAEALRAMGYRIWIPLFGHPHFTKTELETVAGVRIDAVVGYMLGALVGDGALNQQCERRQFGFTNTDQECVAGVKAGLQLLGADLNLQRTSRYQYSIRKSAMLRKILRIAKVDCTSYYKRIPDFILSSPKAVLAAFLRGLFDTDGTADKRGTVSFTTTSEQLGVDTQNALMAFGILSVRRPKKSASGRPTWDVNVMGEYATKFGNDIGFAIKRKQDRIRPLETITNRNRYGYPDAIKEVLRQIVRSRPLGPKTPKSEIKFKKYFRRKGSRAGALRPIWILNRKLPWGMEIIQVESEEEARTIEAGLTAKRNAFLSANLKDRTWHLQNRSMQQAFMYVPSPEKLQKFISNFDCREQLEDFLISDIWVELKSVSHCTADLADLCVPGPHSFLCSGAINHNSIGALHELVEYCYRNENCLGYIVVKEIGMATEGGAWHKLNFEILPVWQEGMGLRFTESRLEANSKKPYIWIANRHGSWSMIMLSSLPVAHQVEGKIRGREPQIIFVDEAQTLDSDTYFTSLLMQLGRRQGSDDPSKIIFACNPEGPSHWLYHRFFVMPVNEETGEWDQRYAKWHIPYSDNKDNLPPGYYENYVLPAVQNDPIAKARLVDGEWVDRPSGNGLFAAMWVPSAHVRGNAIQSQGLVPVPGQSMIVSYDLGAAHSSLHFQQIVPTLRKIYKLTVDEIDHVGDYVPYTKLVPEIIRRMIYWEKVSNCQFAWEHISDDSAFNQYRAATGSFDCWDVEKASRLFIKQAGLPERFVIKMKPCPKGEHSIESRVRMVADDLITESVMVSATCRRTIEMFERLEEDKENRMKPKKKHRYGHNFDSYSYGFFFYSTSFRQTPGAFAKVQPVYRRIGG